MTTLTSSTLCVSMFLLSSCAPPEDSPQDPIAEKSPTASSENRLEAPAPDDDGVTRVLVLHDMEGLTGQDDPDTFLFSKPERYREGRRYLIGDVNAVIEGLFEGGADEVHVVDGHGSGNPEPDILLDELDPRAEMILRDQPFRQYVDLVEPSLYDAVTVVGMHAKTGSRGFASHTYTLGIEWRLNGSSVTETEIVGFSFGRVGTPVIFASGDDRLAIDLETMPWIEYVTVKQATSASTAELRPIDEARKDLREGARRALENRENAKAMKIGVPIEVALHAVPPSSLEVLAGVPGIDYQNDTATFMAENFEQAYDGLVALTGVAMTNTSSLLVETVSDHPDGGEILGSYRDRMLDRWLDFESGRFTAEAPTPPAEGRRYHGAR